MVVLLSGVLGFYLHVFLSSLSPPLLRLVMSGRGNNRMAPDRSTVEKWLSRLSGQDHASTTSGLAKPVMAAAAGLLFPLPSSVLLFCFHFLAKEVKQV